MIINSFKYYTCYIKYIESPKSVDLWRYVLLRYIKKLKKASECQHSNYKNELRHN